MQQAKGSKAEAQEQATQRSRPLGSNSIIKPPRTAVVNRPAPNGTKLTKSLDFTKQLRSMRQSNTRLLVKPDIKEPPGNRAKKEVEKREEGSQQILEGSAAQAGQLKLG